MRLLMFILAIVALMYSEVTFAQENADVNAVSNEEAPSDKVQVKNKICPIDGEEIGSMEDEESATAEHAGKIYNLCCAHCIETFQKDPEKFAKMAEDEASQSSAEESHEGHDHTEEGHEHDKHEGHNHE